jgi:hypothetical protein
MRNDDVLDEGDGGESFEDFAARFPSRTRDAILADPAERAEAAEAAAKAEAGRVEAERTVLARAIARHLAADQLVTHVPDGMLTTIQVARRLGLKKIDGVLALIHKGDLIASNVSQGKKRSIWRVRVADLDAFIEKTKATPPAPNVRRKKRKTAARTQYFAEQ